MVTPINGNGGFLVPFAGARGQRGMGVHVAKL